MPTLACQRWVSEPVHARYDSTLVSEAIQGLSPSCIVQGRAQVRWHVPVSGQHAHISVAGSV